MKKNGKSPKNRNSESEIDVDINGVFYQFDPNKRRKPYMPNSYHCEIADAGKLFEVKKPPPVRISLAPNKDFEGLVDAETGEPISITKANWNVREGRVNMDTRSILAMGTGKLDIANKTPTKFMDYTPVRTPNSKAPTPSTPNRSVILPPIAPLTPILQSQIPSPRPNQIQRHPIVTQYLLEGPMNQRFHKYWNKRTDSVEITAENREDIQEEDAAYYAPNQYSSNENNNNRIVIGTPGTLARNLAQLDAQFEHNLQITTDQDHIMQFKSDSIYTPTHKPYVNLHIDTDARSVASSHNSHNSKGTKSTRKHHEVAFHHTDHKLVPTNLDNWLAVEEKVYQEIFSLASQLEQNKSLTQEAPCKGGMQGVRRNCRYLARLKIKGMEELVQAIEDEKAKDAVRDAAEFENSHKPPALQDIMRKTHGEERKKSRLYMTALQQDSEIAFIHKMSEFGYLW